MNVLEAMSLYVIPDAQIGCPRSIYEQAELAIAGGATAIQLRDKSLASRELLCLARELSALCRRLGALFIVNDRLDIALLSDAHGVHVGQEDIAVEDARRLCPPGFIVGVSASNPVQAIEAEKKGANYIGIGAVFSTSTKLEAKEIGVKGLAETISATSLPTVAIGGINLGNAKSILETGVSGLAVISSIVGHSNITAASRSFFDIICDYKKASKK